MRDNMKKIIGLLIILVCVAMHNSNIEICNAKELYEYVGEDFKVTYVINNQWEKNFYDITFEIENIGSETIRNWYLGMSLEGEIENIWDATIYTRIDNHYVIKNAIYNSSIDPGEKLSFGCIVKLIDSDELPKEFYMPVKLEVVKKERYEVKSQVKDSWEGGKEYQVIIKNKSRQTIEDWTLEFEFEGEIETIWNGTVTEHNGIRYVIANNEYNGFIKENESVTFNFIVNSYVENCLSELMLYESISTGINDAEKLVNERIFQDLDIITDQYEITPLYTLDGQISAYLVQYYDVKGKATGYIVVSNQVKCLNYYIEFGKGSPDIINKMVDLVEIECGEKVDRLIYVGGYTYYASVGEKIYTVTNATVRLVSEEDEQQLIAEGGTPQYYQKEITLSLADVFEKEVGYDYASPLVISPGKANLSKFKTMAQTKEAYKQRRQKEIDNNCGPTAALNLLYCLDKRGYKTLSLEGMAWKDTFCELYDRMMTLKKDNSGDKTTYDSDFKDTIEELLIEYDELEVNLISIISWEAAIERLNEGVVVFLLQNSQIYGNHYVLGTGYKYFEFESGWTSRYFQIVDGWTDDYRFVNYSLGIDYINAITVE